MTTGRQRRSATYLKFTKCGTFVEKNAAKCQRLAQALVKLGFRLTETDTEQVLRGKNFIQLKNGPFDLDLVFAPDGIERFEDAWDRRVEVSGFPVCGIDDIVKEAANRVKDRESLPRLRKFRDWLREQRE